MLLIDHISGRTDRQLKSLDKTVSEGGVDLTHTDLLDRLVEIRDRLRSGTPLEVRDRSFLVKIKDQLNILASPAKGSSISYTLLFSSAKKEIGADVPLAAFPEILNQARRYKYLTYGLLSITLILAFSACFILWNLSHGVRLATQFETARRGEAEAAARIYSALNLKPKPQGAEVYTVENLAAFCRIRTIDQNPSGVAGRDDKKPIIIDSEIRQLCNDYAYRSALYCVSILDMGAYKNSFVFNVSARILASGAVPGKNGCADLDGTKAARTPKQAAAEQAPVIEKGANVEGAVAQAPEGSAKTKDKDQTGTNQGEVGKQEDAQTVIAVLTTMINHIMPMVFGFIGAAVALIRSTQQNLAQFTLNPRDYILSLIRLVLGAVVGACVGLFLSTESIPSQPITQLFHLSASSIAFVAGYGADAFFKMIDGVLSRIFDLEPLQPSPGPKGP